MGSYDDKFKSLRERAKEDVKTESSKAILLNDNS